MVFMKYCDGGSFSGNNATVNSYNNHPLYFRGFKILQAMRDDLFNNRGLKVRIRSFPPFGFSWNSYFVSDRLFELQQFATDAVISGCSAGGLATFLHLDWWKANLANNTHVAGMPDSGFFLDFESPRQRFETTLYSQSLYKNVKYLSF